jgi:hypothetical protein
MGFVVTGAGRVDHLRRCMRAWLPVAALACKNVHAGRPLVTDDAGLIEAKACQFETWLQRNRDSDEYWAVPACNVTGNFEIALGGARIDASEESQTVGVLQAKTLFKPLQTNGWGVGLVFGDRFTRRSRSEELYAFVPVSVSLRDDLLLLHTNLGWLRQRAEPPDGRRHRATWSVGAEGRVAANTFLSVETFGEIKGDSLYQVGIRHWLVTERIQVDATYGSRLGHRDEYWFSLGMKFVTAPLLP